MRWDRTEYGVRSTSCVERVMNQMNEQPSE